jgi:hypothetical protein
MLCHNLLLMVALISGVLGTLAHDIELGGWIDAEIPMGTS